MQTLWREEVPPQPTTSTNVTHVRTITDKIVHKASDCPIFGHDWQTIGMSGEKQCRTCGVRGYCPGCTGTPLSSALPFSCVAHFLPEEEVSA